MSAPSEGLILLLIEHGYSLLIPMTIFAVLRPWMMFTTFTGMQWATGQSRVLRIALAIGVGAPVALATAEPLGRALLEASTVLLIGFAAVEIAIGAGLGILASLPFLSLQYAGAIGDQIRGESDSGGQSPDGGTISTFGKYYMVIGFTVFALLGGFSHLIGALYHSYAVWPVTSAPPEPNSILVMQVMQFFSKSLLVAVQIAVPTIVLLFAIELFCGIGARIGQRLNFYNLAFPFKNVFGILSLLVLTGFVWNVSEHLMMDTISDLAAWRALSDE